MKKKFVNIALLLLGVLALTACSDDDDNDANTNPGIGRVIDNSNVVENDAQAEALVNGTYQYWQPLSSGFSFDIEAQTSKMISFEGDEDKEGPLNSRLEQTTDTWYQIRQFSLLYLGIANDNNAIHLIQDNPKVSDAAKNSTIGKAKLLRGLAYLYLVQLWGEVPIRTENDTASTERKPIDEVYNQIVSDLTDAENLLPETSSSPVDPTKDAADALLSRAYLAWGNNPLTYEQVQAIADQKVDPAPSYNKERLEKAVEYADKVIQRGHHSLLNDFTHLSGRAWESENQERILTIRHDGDNVDAFGNHQTHCGWTFPFQAYENGDDGLPDPTKPKADPTQNHLEVADADLYYDWARDYPDDSIRRNWSYKTNIYNPETGKYYKYLPPVYVPVPGKAVDESWDDAVNKEITLNDNDRIEIRYAEVLLNKAEALVELGRNQEAAEPFNQIQERAYKNSNHNLASVSLDDIKTQWDHEFVYEQKSLLNNYRWKTVIADIEKVTHYEHYDDSYAVAGQIGRDGNVVSPFFAKVHKHLVAKWQNVRGKDYRQPIPVGQTGEDLGVTPQNPGY